MSVPMETSPCSAGKIFCIVCFMCVYIYIYIERERDR